MTFLGQEVFMMEYEKIFLRESGEIDIRLQKLQYFESRTIQNHVRFDQLQSYFNQDNHKKVLMRKR